MISSLFRFTIVGVTLLAAAGNVGAQARPRLGPVDGAGLSSLDTGRVTVSTVAPDWSLESKDGSIVTLSQFRGKKTVVLVFYRGHW